VKNELNDINAAINGDNNAYARIIKRHQAHVAKIMWRFCLDKNTCEELTQDVFMEAYFSLKSYKAKAPLENWLSRIATRVGYKFWKEKKSRKESLPLEELDKWSLDTDNLQAKEAAQLLYSLLNKLPPKDRLVLTLMYFEDCSVKQIANRTAVTVPMVKMRIHRARKKMKIIAEELGIAEALK